MIFDRAVKALFEEMHEDPWVAAPLAVFDAVIVGIDVVILTIKAIATPSTYCMRDTRRHLSEMVRQHGWLTPRPRSSSSRSSLHQRMTANHLILRTAIQGYAA